MNKSFNLGFMQGRLSPIVRNKIQAFPFQNWKKEFYLAKKIGFNLMEWTIDEYNYQKNPILINNEVKEIKKLKKKYKIKINSITCDFLMEQPFYKKKINNNLNKQFKFFLNKCSDINIKIIVVPLVDKGSIKNKREENNVINFFKNIKNFLKSKKLTVAFESDYEPKKLKRFIRKFDPDTFGINYDMGNSSGLNYNYKKEIGMYFNRILNVHIKDKDRSNKTVPLFSGKTEILKILKFLTKKGYKGNYILQPARSHNEHLNMMKNYSIILKNYVKKF